MVWLLGTGIVIALFIFIAHEIVSFTCKSKIYAKVHTIPKNKVGLLLGTGKYLKNGNLNVYYTNRIVATADLFHNHKIEFILVSGDNSRREYDEPTTIKEDLIQKGIPESKIYLDYAGFRTYDSMVRCKKVFGQDKITVISQKFHNERALYIAKWKGIDAIGFNAGDASYKARVTIREYFARCKMFLDLLFGKKPKFLGERIEIK